MMIRLGALTVCMLLALPATAMAQPKSSPLFQAFLQFCADPDMNPLEVRKAVEIAGGTLFKPETTTDFPYRMSAASWNVTVQGQKFLMNAGGGRVPHGAAMIQETLSCSVMGDDSDGAAQAELKAWVGVPPYSPGSSFYDFVWDGQTRTPLVDGPTFRADSEGGKSWTLAINGSGKFTTVMLTHFLKPTPKQ